MTTERLAIELKTYEEHLPELAAQAGKYVLIKGDTVVDTFDSYEDALKQGYTKFQLDPFLVKKISQGEQALFFTRDFSQAMACQA
ncbi:MAG: hypothetical protein ACTJHY_06095 [Alcaligenes pakistanensis]